MSLSELFITRGSVSGDGRPLVVLVHGAPDRSRAFSKVTPMLADYDVITYDRRGYGESLHATPAQSLADHVDDLLAIVDERPVTLVGHSVGATVVFGAAIRRPDLVRSLGVWEAPMPWVDWWPTPNFRQMLEGIATTPDPEHLGEQFTRNARPDGAWDRLGPERQQQLRAEGVSYQRDIRSILEPPYELSDIKCPAVLASGATTTTGHVEAARVLAPMIGAELMEVAGAGHFGPVAHPDEFVVMARRAVALGWPEHAGGR